METNPSGYALLVSKDLYFTSRITGATDNLGYRLELVDDAEAAAEAVAAQPPICVIMDLANREMEVAELMQALPSEPAIPVIAFGAHVNIARLQEARQAGCCEVFSKGQFAAGLPEILNRYLGNEGHGNTSAS